MGLSIFWRLALGSLAIIVVVAGVNIYALSQLRQLSALSTELVSYHYPAIETAKRLIASLYTQLRSEKKYLAVRDEAFLKDFDEEVEEFRKTLTFLVNREASPQGQKLLQDVERLHDEYLALFREAATRQSGPPHKPSARYENQRDTLMAQMPNILTAYGDLHEDRVGTMVKESRERSVRAETITRQLVILALLLGLVLAGVASYSILRPLRRLQEHIRIIGQGHFGGSLEVAAPSDLRELVETVNWMGKKLQELDDMKAEFLAHVSHELRSPLASIHEGIQILLDEIPGPLSKDQRETLQIMTDSSQRLIHMISTLLDLSKIEAGMMEYRIALTDLKRLAEGSVNKIRLLAERKHVQIVVEAPSRPLWVPADGARIEQVLDNLLSNALKFSPNGAAVNLLLESDPQARVVHVSVADRGPGISPEDLPHIFERFYQGRVQEKTSVAGSGLGLALAKKVVEAHGGRIWAQSETGKGTSIHFILPFTQPGVSP